MYRLNEKLLVETQQKITQSKSLDAKLLSDLRTQFGERLDRALKTLEEGHVKKYIFKPSERELWIVVGRIRDYQVIPRLFCMCDDFYLNVVIRRTDALCYHILAQMIAESTNRVDKIEETDEKFGLLIREWSDSSED